MLLKVPATISKVTTMADNTLRLNVDTQETSSEDKAAIMELYNQLGVFLFHPTDIKEEDLVSLPDIKTDKGQKTPSQRLRNRMFVYYKDRYKKDDGFESWYISEIERIGNSYLDKINT